MMFFWRKCRGIARAMSMLVLFLFLLTVVVECSYNDSQGRRRAVEVFSLLAIAAGWRLLLLIVR